jgi:hypothetical protein
MTFCTTCGHQKNGSERYCTTCGTTFPDADSPPAGGPGPPPHTATPAGQSPVPPTADTNPKLGAPADRYPPQGIPGPAPAHDTDGIWPTGSGWQGSQASPDPRYPLPGGTGTAAPDWQQPAGRSRGKLAGAVIATASVAIAAVGIVAALAYSHHNNGTPVSAPTSTPSLSVPPSPSAAASLSVPSSPSAPASPSALASPSAPSSTTAPASPPASATGATAEAQATTVSALLASSAQSRSTLNTSTVIADITQCTDIGNDIQQMQQIASERMSEYNQAVNLQTGAIPNGAALTAEFTTALRISLDIDNDYLHWAQQQQSSNCTAGESSPYYEKTVRLNPTATKDKGIFLGTWNPVARQYSLQRFNAYQI